MKHAPGKRPLTLSDGTEVVVGLKLYSLSAKSVVDNMKEESKNSCIRKWSGGTVSKVHEYKVVYINQAEASRSFVVKSAFNCENTYSLKGCDSYLSRMNFKASIKDLITDAQAQELKHIEKIKRAIKSNEEYIESIERQYKKKNEIAKAVLAKLLAGTKALPKTLKPSKSC